MDLALASQFVAVQVPNLSAMKDTQLDRILGKNGTPKKASLRAMLAEAKGTVARPKDRQNAQNLAKKVARDLAQTEIVFNPRQLTMMVRLLVGGLALRTVTDNPKFSDPDANTAYVESVIPEIQGIVRSKVNREKVHGVIRTVVGGFSLGDPVMMARKPEKNWESLACAVLHFRTHADWGVYGSFKICWSRLDRPPSPPRHNIIGQKKILEIPPKRSISLFLPFPQVTWRSPITDI